MSLVLRNSFWPGFINDRYSNNLASDFGFSNGINKPAVNIVEGKNNFRVEVAAPGLAKKDFVIDVNNDLLTISSEKEYNLEKDGDEFRRREFCYSSFSRSFSLPDSVDSDKIKATYQNGILSVEVPKKEEAKEKAPRKIAIA